MFSVHSNYNVKYTRHAVQCQKFMLAVVGRKSLVMLCRMGSQRGLILGPLCCLFMVGLLTVIAACSNKLSCVLFCATVSMVVLFHETNWNLSPNYGDFVGNGKFYAIQTQSTINYVIRNRIYRKRNDAVMAVLLDWRLSRKTFYSWSHKICCQFFMYGKH